MNLLVLQNRYRVIQVLSDRGGFGITYLAEDTQMPSGRRCVIKQLRPINNDPQLYRTIQERFQREAVILEQLGHNNPQIPDLYAYFEDGGQFYLVEELIEGLTLTQKMQQEGKLSESMVKSILSSLLPVIEYIHSYRIIHRDIKPDNIILRYGDNLPVLLDFGAVKETMGTVMTASGNITSSIVIGTAGFMPSEQSAGRPVFASDLYSLGLTAIYLLTGKLPHDLNTDMSTGEIFWRQQAFNVSPSLGNILDKVIRSHPRDRYLNSREMLEALHTSSNIYNVPVQTPPINNNFGNNPANYQNTPVNYQANPPVNQPIKQPINYRANPQVNPPSAPTQISTANNNYPVNQSSPQQSQPTVIATPQQPDRSGQLTPQTTVSSTSRGLKDWQKPVIIGSIVGLFVMGALLANNFIKTSKSKDDSQSIASQTTAINSPDNDSTVNSTPTPTPTNSSNTEQINPTPTPTNNTNNHQPNKPLSENQPQAINNPTSNPTSNPTNTSTSNPTPVPNNALITQDEAVGVIRKWQDYKRRIMGQSHEVNIGSEILTGKAYQDNIQRGDGQASSSQWLIDNKSYYTYGVQQIDGVDSFVTSGDQATIDTVVTEQRTLYKADGSIDRNASSFDKRLVRYNLQRDNGIWKISDYNTVRVIWKK
jgi:serine/threonine-protein kinase